MYIKIISMDLERNQKYSIWTKKYIQIYYTLELLRFIQKYKQIYRNTQ